jgi:hypothetical protein
VVSEGRYLRTTTVMLSSGFGANQRNPVGTSAPAQVKTRWASTGVRVTLWKPRASPGGGGGVADDVLAGGDDGRVDRFATLVEGHRLHRQADVDPADAVAHEVGKLRLLHDLDDVAFAIPDALFGLFVADAVDGAKAVAEENRRSALELLVLDALRFAFGQRVGADLVMERKGERQALVFR